jgi:hypothetical protein
MRADGFPLEEGRDGGQFYGRGVENWAILSARLGEDWGKPPSAVWVIRKGGLGKLLDGAGYGKGFV